MEKTEEVSTKRDKSGTANGVLQTCPPMAEAIPPLAEMAIT